MLHSLAVVDGLYTRTPKMAWQLLKKNIPSTGLLSRLRERVLETTHLAQNIEFEKGINLYPFKALNTSLRDRSVRSTGLRLTTAGIILVNISYTCKMHGCTWGKMLNALQISNIMLFWIFHTNMYSSQMWYILYYIKLYRIEIG